jgi:hypothetical protein
MKLIIFIKWGHLNSSGGHWAKQFGKVEFQKEDGKAGILGSAAFKGVQQLIQQGDMRELEQKC